MILLVPAAEPKLFMRQIQKIESFAGLQHPAARANAFRCERLSDRSGGGIAEQRIG
jgi:hypothetical protein